MIIINSSSYSAYESGNLRNVEFLYHNGSVIPSWLESGAYNSSFSTVYWLKLDNGIPANSNLSILLGFASKNTRLMDGITVGEAPGVSHVYGKYDNGANIFRFYDNFSGTSLNGSSWVSNDTIRYVNDGLILNFQSSGGYFASTSTFGAGNVSDALVQSIEDMSNIGFLNTSQKLPNAGNMVAGDFIRTACGHTYSDQWNASFGEANPCGNLYGYLLNREGAQGVYSIHRINNGESISYFDNNPGKNTQPIINGAAGNFLSLGFESQAPELGVQWLRVRALPPNNVMPTEYVNASLQNNNVTEIGFPFVSTLVINTANLPHTTAVVDGNAYTLQNGTVKVRDLAPGTHNVLITNPFRQFYSSSVNVVSQSPYILNVTLSAPIPLNENYSFPWIPLGPANMPNPQGLGNFFQSSSGHIGLIAIQSNNSDIMYVASGTSGPGDSGPFGAGGVYKTCNGGVSWFPIDLGLPYDIASSLYLNQSSGNILVGFMYHGIYESSDGGGHWGKVSNFTGSKDITRANNLLFAGSRQGVIESIDGGASWSLIYAQKNIRALSISGNTIFAYSISDQTLYKSSNLGTTWSLAHDFANVAYDVWSVSASPFNSSLVYVSIGALNGVLSNTWVSHDGGINFILATNISYTKEVFFDPINSSRIWAYGPGYFAYSFNGGRTFVSDPQQTDNMGLAVDKGNDNMLVLGSDQGIYVSYDSGVSWHSLNNNLSNTLDYGVSVGENGTLIIASMQDYSAWISHDGGKVWLGGNTPPIPLANEDTIAYVNPYNSTWVYGIHSGSPLEISSNGGYNFTSQNIVMGPQFPISQSIFSSDPFNHSKVFVATSSGVYVGDNFGKLWSLIPGSPLNSTVARPISSSSMIVGTTNGIYLYKSGSWSRSTYMNGYVNSITVDPANSSIVIVGIAAQGVNEQVFLSEDGGNTFQQVVSQNSNIFAENPSEPFPTAQLYFVNVTGDPLIGATQNGIYVSTDLGTSWQPISYNLLSGDITGVTFRNSSLYISTYGEGVLKYPNFSLNSLAATVLGYTNNLNITLKINDTAIPIYDGYFRDFLKPGNYEISLTDGAHKYLTNITLLPQEIYNLSSFSGQLSTVTFTESGLASGTTWSVTLNGSTQSSTGSTVSFTEPNGTYSYALGTVSGYTSSLSSGSVTVNGTNQGVSVTFTAKAPATYTVTFTESGLPSGTTWYVNLSNGVDSGAITGSLYTFYMTNGTYSYTIATTNKIYEASSGSFIVNGGSVSKPVSFSEVKYTVTFTESGLPSGTTWYVNLSNGQSFSSTTSTISFSEPNGTYSYTIGNVLGYQISPSSGSINVNGNNVTNNITFTVKSSLYGISTTEIYYIFGAVVAVAVIGSVLAIRRKK